MEDMPIDEVRNFSMNQSVILCYENYETIYLGTVTSIAGATIHLTNVIHIEEGGVQEELADIDLHRNQIRWFGIIYVLYSSR